MTTNPLIGGTGGTSGEILLTSAFIAYETSFNFSQFLPSIMTIRTFVDTPDKVEMIRQGEKIAAFYSGGFALIFGCILSSWLPIVLAALSIAATVGVYEWALRGAPAWGWYCTGIPPVAWGEGDE